MESVSPERITISIYGLTTDDRPTRAVEQALLRLPGVSRAYVSAATEMAYVEYDSAQTSHAQLLQAIEGVGLRAGELNIRAVGSMLAVPPLPARRRARPAGTEPGAPAILTTPPAVGAVGAVGRPTVAQRAALGAREAYSARYSLAYLSGLVRGCVRGQLSGTGVLRPRRRHFAGFLGLAVLTAILGALLWPTFAGQAVPENTFTVEIGASGFSPVAIVLPAGKPATLRVRNDDLASAHISGTTGAMHRFTISELGINVKLQPGQSAVINLGPMQPATYHYFCDLCCGGINGNGNDPTMQGALIVH
jgi:hypothetical protein